MTLGIHELCRGLVVEFSLDKVLEMTFILRALALSIILAAAPSNAQDDATEPKLELLEIQCVDSDRKPRQNDTGDNICRIGDRIEAKVTVVNGWMARKASLTVLFSLWMGKFSQV